MTTELLAPILALSGGAGIVYYLKGIPSLIYNRIKRSLIHTVTVYQYDEMFDALESYLKKRCENKYKDVEAQMDGYDVIYKQEENLFVFKAGDKKILISKAKEKLDKAQTIKEIYFRKFIVRGYKAKKQIETLLTSAAKEWEDSQKESDIRIYTTNRYGEWDASSLIKPKPLNSIVLGGTTKEFLSSDVEKFITSEHWYETRGIPYKRGYCLYGPPGNGKSSLALALAKLTAKTICILNLNSFENDDALLKAMRGVRKNCIILIEDIDSVFNKREAVKEKSISFSNLLNFLDGALYQHGIMTIITTNHIEKLDEALLRDGRMDIKVEIEAPTEKEISEYLSIFYEQDVAVNGEFNLSMATVQGICMKNKDNINQCKLELHKQSNKNERVTQEVLATMG